MFGNMQILVHVTNLCSSAICMLIEFKGNMLTNDINCKEPSVHNMTNKK